MAPSGAPIDSIKNASESSYVLTGSKQSASVNVWTSNLGLNLVGGYNFKKQAYALQDSKMVEKLYIDSLVAVQDQNGAKVLVDERMAQVGSNKTLANALKSKNDDEDDGEKAPAASLDVPKYATPPQADSPSNADPFSGFALDALFDESHNVNDLESIESGSDFEDAEESSSFQEAWLNSKEPEESKKSSPPPSKSSSSIEFNSTAKPKKLAATKAA